MDESADKNEIVAFVKITLCVIFTKATISFLSAVFSIQHVKFHRITSSPSLIDIPLLILIVFQYLQCIKTILSSLSHRKIRLLLLLTILSYFIEHSVPNFFSFFEHVKIIFAFTIWIHYRSSFAYNLQLPFLFFQRLYNIIRNNSFIQVVVSKCRISVEKITVAEARNKIDSSSCIKMSNFCWKRNGCWSNRSFFNRNSTFWYVLFSSFFVFLSWSSASASISCGTSFNDNR